MREPDVVAEPAEVVEVLDRAHPELLQAERLLVEGLGEVGVQPHAAAAGELGGLAHQPRVTLNGEHGRERDADASRPGAGSWKRSIAASQAARIDVAVLDDLVGRQAAVGAPEVHRAAARVEAHADRRRRADLDLEQVAGVRGKT